VKEALLVQMKKTIIQAALDSALLKPAVDTYVRMMERYMLNPTDRNRDRLQEAYDNLMEQANTTSEFVQGMFEDMPMASGGIVTRPTRALIGEAGPEAVIPLGRVGAGLGNTYIIHGSMISERDVDRRVAAAVARKSRGF
jgi:hypothetical protein